MTLSQSDEQKYLAEARFLTDQIDLFKQGISYWKSTEDKQYTERHRRLRINELKKKIELATHDLSELSKRYSV